MQFPVMRTIRIPVPSFYDIMSQMFQYNSGRVFMEVDGIVTYIHISVLLPYVARFYTWRTLHLGVRWMTFIWVVLATSP